MPPGEERLRRAAIVLRLDLPEYREIYGAFYRKTGCGRPGV